MVGFPAVNHKYSFSIKQDCLRIKSYSLLTKAITIERRSWKLRCYHCLANNMFVGRGGIEPPSSDFQSAALTTSATTPKFHLFNCHKWQNLNMSFLTHFSLFSQSYVCYIYIILQIFSKSKH